MGGLTFFAGSMIKSFSRRVQTICLSSAEAELHAIVEGAHEGISVALMAECFMVGLPARDELGNFVKTTGVIPLELHSDSQSAVHVAHMAGL